jgi:hypothetical protein
MQTPWHVLIGVTLVLVTVLLLISPAIMLLVARGHI